MGVAVPDRQATDEHGWQIDYYNLPHNIILEVARHPEIRESALKCAVMIDGKRSYPIHTEVANIFLHMAGRDKLGTK